MATSSPKRSAGKENLAVLSPLQLSPAPNVHQSPHGLAYDVLIKPPSAKKSLIARSPKSSSSPLANLSKKLRMVEKNKQVLKKEEEEKKRLREEKLKAAQSYVSSSVENHQKQTLTKSLSKIQLAEENREANLQAKAEKAKKELTKVDNGLAALKKKREELDEKVKQDLQKKEEMRLSLLTKVKETCGSHVEAAKSRAVLLREQKEEGSR